MAYDDFLRSSKGPSCSQGRLADKEDLVFHAKTKDKDKKESCRSDRHCYGNKLYRHALQNFTLAEALANICNLVQS